MKKGISAIILFSFGVLLFAQNHGNEFRFRNRNLKKNCDEIVQRLDSVIGYKNDPVTSIEFPEYVLRFTYQDDLCISTKKYSIPGYEPVYNQIFAYNEAGKMKEYLYQEWDGTAWNDKVITSYFYEDGLLSKELFTRVLPDGTREEYQQHFYRNEDGRAVEYLRQVKNQQGEWYDFAYHHFIYDSYGNLVVLYGEYIKNSLVYWRRTSDFDNDGKITERVLEVLRYDYDLKQNVLRPELHQVFAYDIYSDVSEIFNESMMDGEWTRSGRLEYFWSLLKDKKVSICHNGHTICVSVNAVKAHLAHGDKIGECDTDENGEEEGNTKRNENRDRSGIKEDIDISIYPNPTQGNVSVSFEDADHSFKGVYLLSPAGTTVDYFNAEGASVLNFSVHNLKSGTYFLRFTGDDGDVWKTLVKK